MIARGLRPAEVPRGGRRPRANRTHTRSTARHPSGDRRHRPRLRSGLVWRHGVHRRPTRAAHGRARARGHARRPGRIGDGRRLMPDRSCDGAGLLEAFRAAVANLEAHVDEINGLNVYPVPDGDTGSNMVATVRAALAEAEAVAG